MTQAIATWTELAGLRVEHGRCVNCGEQTSRRLTDMGSENGVFTDEGMKCCRCRDEAALGERAEIAAICRRLDRRKAEIAKRRGC